MPKQSLCSISVVAITDKHRRSAIVFSRFRPPGELGGEVGGVALPSPLASVDRFARLSIICIDSSPARAMSLNEVETFDNASQTLILNGRDG